MKLLLKNVLINDKFSKYDQKKVHISIDKGIIKEIHTEKIPAAGNGVKDIDCNGKCASPSWVDLHAHFCDPGHEHRETLTSGRKVATDAGFSHTAILPETTPPLENKESIRYILAGNNGQPAHLIPYAAATENLQGEHLTQMYDLVNAGAAGFTDGNIPVTDGGTLIRAMLYAGTFGKPFLNTPRDTTIDRFGSVHEGKIHLFLGLKGQPDLSETLAVQRNIAISDYTGSALHLTKISSRHSLHHIQKAKDKGLPVTCGVSINNLLFSEEDLETMDTRLKLSPPLRSTEDRAALRKAVKSGLIDCIVSDHYPLEKEQKTCEFESAEYGAIGLQTMLPAILQSFGNKSHSDWLHAITTGPRKVLGLSDTVIKVNAPALLTLYDPKEKWVLNQNTNLSHSHNSPLWEQNLTGRVFGLINKNTSWFRKT